MHSPVLILSILLGLTISVFTIRVVLARSRRARTGTARHDEAERFRKAEKSLVPRLGGVALIFGFLIGAVAIRMVVGKSSNPASIQWAFVAANLMMFSVGFADDLRRLSAPVKLALQLLVALLTFHMGIRIEVLSVPFSDGYFELGAYSLPVTVFWLILIPNLLNLVDGMDGLAGGIGLFLCLTIGALAMIAGHPEVVVLSAVMCGSIGGFLIYNLPPARIYLGDGGSHLIGFYIASSSLLAASKGSVAAALVVVLLALAFPILDTVVSVARRVLTGVPFWKPDAGHLHHRLMSLGVSKQSILLVLYGAFFTICLTALGAFLIGGYAFLVVAMLCGMLSLRLFHTVGYLNSWSQLVTIIRNRLRSRRQIQFASALATVLTHQYDRCRNGEEFWREFELLTSRAGILPVDRRPTETTDADFEPMGNDPADPTQERQSVVPLIGGGNWRFRTRRGVVEGEIDWVHVARPFLPVASQAVERWPDAASLAMQLGFGLPASQCGLRNETARVAAVTAEV